MKSLDRIRVGNSFQPSSDRIYIFGFRDIHSLNYVLCNVFWLWTLLTSKPTSRKTSRMVPAYPQLFSNSGSYQCHESFISYQGWGQGEKRRSMPPGKSLKSTVPELPFSAFWEIILKNSEDYIKPHIKYTKDDRFQYFFHSIFHIHYKILL